MWYALYRVSLRWWRWWCRHTYRKKVVKQDDHHTYIHTIHTYQVVEAWVVACQEVVVSFQEVVVSYQGEVEEGGVVSFPEEEIPSNVVAVVASLLGVDLEAEVAYQVEEGVGHLSLLEGELLGEVAVNEVVAQPVEEAFLEVGLQEVEGVGLEVELEH